MRRFIVIIQLLTAACCLWCSCTAGNSETEMRLFSGMDSLLEANPDSTYKELTAMQKEVDSIDDEAVSNQYVIYMAEAFNKLDRALPSDTILKTVARYYDIHGTSNQLMKARYLLGCYYRDSGESPLAIDYYEQSVDCADTSDVGCDYLTLMRIYGQMAKVYLSQSLPSKVIEADKKYSYYAQKIGNQYEYIRGIQNQSEVNV